MIGLRGRFSRCDLPAIIVLFILILFLFLSLTARAAEGAVLAVSTAASDGTVKELIDLLGSSGQIGVVFVLWYYSRQFRQDSVEKDKQVRELEKSNAEGWAHTRNLAANYEDMVRGRHGDSRSATGRVNPGG